MVVAPGNEDMVRRYQWLRVALKKAKGGGLIARLI